MARSVSIIDYKVKQADFFLERLEECGYDFFAAQCYSDAFASACRSITFSIQAVCKQLSDFDGWYLDEQARMKADPLCVFFNNYRTANIHVGGTPVLAGEMKNGEARFFFRPSPDVPAVPELDVVNACRSHFKNVVDLVFRLYVRFPTDLDDRWHYTKEHFSARGLALEDALESLGFPRTWACRHSPSLNEEDQWHALRGAEASGPEIQHIFQKYLNRVVEGPDNPAR
jgi:hypothetical protein